MKVKKFLKAFAVFIGILIPPALYLYLSYDGYLGTDFTDTLLHKIILGILGLFVLVMGLIWQPFYFWRRLFKPPGPKSKILQRGKSAVGIIKKLGERSEGFDIIDDRPYFSIPLEIEVKKPESSYTVECEAIVPASTVPWLKEDLEVPIKVDKDDKEKVAIDWDNF